MRRPAESSNELASGASKVYGAIPLSYAQDRGQIGPVEGAPRPCKTSLTSVSRLIAAFNARRTVGESKGGFDELNAITYWYRRSKGIT